MCEGAASSDDGLHTDQWSDAAVRGKVIEVLWEAPPGYTYLRTVDGDVHYCRLGSMKGFFLLEPPSSFNYSTQAIDSRYDVFVDNHGGTVLVISDCMLHGY